MSQLEGKSDASSGVTGTSPSNEAAQLREWLASVGFEKLFDPMIKAEWNSLYVMQHVMHYVMHPYSFI